MGVFSEPRKLGEGVYGEVFATKYKGKPTALKVIPFHGDKAVYKGKVNGEYLLDAASILPEILINRELSALFDPTAEFSTPNFIELLNTHVVKGLYPEEFMVAWNEFDEANGSENDPPTSYASKQQLFIVMGMAMGGVDLEHYQMKNEDQVMSVLLQIAISLVVAEERLKFEHRDLHIGNALVLESGEDMKGDWMSFNPKSNCFWMHYLAMQLINKRKCKKVIPKKRRNELQRIWDHLLEFDSLRELFTHDDFYDILQRHLIIKPLATQNKLD
ncbi:hypothetical protein TELCIR_18724 [Teladorsagia circumcincta]|uniref:non-specific serine/threonine protein kinase n=1 Tax=Teladorsagia circumcincta TaxID=45464 RepID=A0A2G9TR76_TELCI|nr:hypothetical protein TELCIR_18724 [Teladorsagia circumcincta]